MALHQGKTLREHLKVFDLLQDDIAMHLSMTRQNLNHHLRKDVLDDNFVRLIKEKLGFISMEKGFSEEFIKEINGKAGLPKRANYKENKSSPSKTEEGTPIYEITATAGQDENVGQLPEVPAFRIKLPGYEDCNFGMQVYGHSMYPTVETGSLVLCRKVSDKSIIMFGEIYLIRTADYLMVKRLQKGTEAGNVTCTSDNFETRNEKFKRFEPFEIAVDKIIDLYIVKGIIKKTQS